MRLSPGDECGDNGESDVRHWSAILLSAAVGAAASGPPSVETAAQWERDGRFLFFACEFKQAARAFEKASVEQPDSAVIHYWLGKSYARLAEVSNPLSAPKDARKARRNLEQAVKIDPRNDEYLRELFDFYLDSPEWFSGGLARAAALLERVNPGEPVAEPWLEQLADSRKEHSGAGWWIERTILWTSGVIGYFVPQP
jgi:tetratricopeptide (TPR) repeat protein